MTVVLDSSAILSVLQNEHSAASIAECMQAADRIVISAPTMVEATMVVESRFGAAGTQQLERLLRRADVDVLDVTEAMGDEAIEGWRRFGKGRHAAALNFGDCFTYALARSLNAPVLCTGNDFVRTDVDTLPA